MFFKKIKFEKKGVTKVRNVNIHADSLLENQSPNTNFIKAFGI